MYNNSNIVHAVSSDIFLNNEDSNITTIFIINNNENSKNESSKDDTPQVNNISTFIASISTIIKSEMLTMSCTN